MGKPPLTSEFLLAAGFQTLGCWHVNATGELAHDFTLPSEPGVYAFAIDGVVQYVGVASRSIRQRLGFYRRPGKTQPTNIRLNAALCDHIGRGSEVAILVAHPPDLQWNGLRISGAPGLEAGLIADFELHWNMRGMESSTEINGSSKMTVRRRILEQIRKRPGMTELELAKFIYGPSAQQPQANAHCRRLVSEGLVDRRGGGGVLDPYVYYPRKP